MPYYTDSPIGTDAPLTDMASSLGSSLGAAVDEAWTGNPSTVIYDYSRIQRANQADRLDKASAEERVKSAGVKLKVPDSGYSAPALDMLIDRKRDEIARQSTLDRAPAGIVPSSARFAASLMTSMLDPINVASAFIPVVGEARMATMLASAGGAVGRLGVRAAVGAAEGAVGAALVEPINYFGRTQMQDDYSMVDSLTNLAFGTVMGGALHGGGGAVGDSLGISRFARDDRVRTAVAAEKARVDAAALLTPEATDRPKPLWFQEPTITTVQDAPFARRWEVTSESARSTALAEMGDDFRTQLVADAGGRAEPGTIPQVRTQLDTLAARVELLDSEAEFKRRAKEFQGQGNSRKESESLARSAVANEKADAQATTERLQQTVDANTRASQAEQDVARLDAGEVPARFAEQVEARAQQIVQASQLERALNDSRTPAAFLVGMADPAQRDAAMRVAVAQAMDGRTPAVDTLFRRNADPVGAARAASERQAAPESLAIADFDASRAADQRIAAAPKSENTAQDLLTGATDRMESLLKNLEQRGYDADRLAQLRKELAPFDDAIADSQKLGDAMKAAATCGIR